MELILGLGILPGFLIIVTALYVYHDVYWPWKFYRERRSELIVLIEHPPERFLRRSKWWKVWEGINRSM